MSSAFAASLLTVRILYSEYVTYIFLGWNLILAWIPYVFSLMATDANRRRRWVRLIVASGLWLLFFPNAPYILTDFLHLAQRGPVPLWYDVLLLASFSWAGIFLAVTSLSMMHAIVREYGGWALGWLFSMSALVLGSLGIYLGRFLRWNSWDVFSAPRAVLSDVAVRMLDPAANRQFYGVTILFAAFLFICYVTLAGSRAEWAPSR
jgi:uncharacterized membrane protein